MLLLAFAAACASGPGEDQLRSERDLAPSDAVEVGRRFTTEERINTIDGADRYHPATLTVDYRLVRPMTEAALFAWYQEQLAGVGWHASSGHTAHQLSMERIDGGYRHRFVVDDVDDDYRVQYRLEDLSCDSGCH